MKRVISYVKEISIYLFLLAVFVIILLLRRRPGRPVDGNIAALRNGIDGNIERIDNIGDRANGIEDGIEEIKSGTNGIENGAGRIEKGADRIREANKLLRTLISELQNSDNDSDN